MNPSKPIRSRFPKTSLKAANLVHVGKSVGILRDAIDDDVEFILYHFRSVSKLTFIPTRDNTHSSLFFDLLENSTYI
jgi:hypothetical protein